jgi:hypothetical protein
VGLGDDGGGLDGLAVWVGADLVIVSLAKEGSRRAEAEVDDAASQWEPMPGEVAGDGKPGVIVGVGGTD